jgi:hypothetical protein
MDNGSFTDGEQVGAGLTVVVFFESIFGGKYAK